MTDLPDTNLVMLTLVKPEGELEVSFERRAMPEPQPHEVLVKVLATPTAFIMSTTASRT